MIVFKVVGAILFTLLMCAAYMSIISAGNWAAVGLCARRSSDVWWIVNRIHLPVETTRDSADALKFKLRHYQLFARNTGFVCELSTMIPYSSPQQVHSGPVVAGGKQ